MQDSIDVTLVPGDITEHPVPLLAITLFQGDDAEALEGFPERFLEVLAGALRDGEFRGRKDDVLLIHASGNDAPTRRLLVLGAGKREEYSAETVRRVAGRAVRSAEKLSIERIALRLEPGGTTARGGRPESAGGKTGSAKVKPDSGTRKGGTTKERAKERVGATVEKALGRAKQKDVESGAIAPEILARAATEGAALAAWDFRELKKESATDGDARSGETGANGELVRRVELSGDGEEAALLEGIRIGIAVARGENLARTLQARPGNIATPTHLGDVAKRAARDFDFEATILGPKELKAESMHALLAVARGSDEEPRLIVLRHNGGTPTEPPLVLIGKGLTFDSGGISLKPPAGMGDMKFDMSGGAAVIGALQAIAELDLPLNVVGIVPSSENLASGRSMKPGDVIRTRAGRTVEVGNTDAEGRLILADALSYAGDFSPAAVVDCATLTGACVLALGHHAAALLGNDEALIGELREAGDRAGERCWPLPLWEEYRKQLDSTVADISNIGGRPAGTITAAHFLREFAGDVSWAHLDIAGTAYGDDPLPYQRKGGYGFPTRLLVEWVRSRAR